MSDETHIPFLLTESQKAALLWQYEMGIDEIIADQPLSYLNLSPDSFKVPTSPPPKRLIKNQEEMRASSPSQEGREVTSPPGASALNHYRSFAEIEAHLRDKVNLPLKQMATNLVYLDGCTKAEILLVGEAPGREEDLQGKPFVGRAGKLLDCMLRAVGLDRRSDLPQKSVLITNTVFWRPPGNRKPSSVEVETCLPYLLRTIALQQPRLIVCLGATPAQVLLKTTEGILSLRGHWSTLVLEGKAYPVLPTLHPAYLLRQPLQKRLAWRDWLSVSQRLSMKRSPADDVS